MWSQHLIKCSRDFVHYLVKGHWVLDAEANNKYCFPKSVYSILSFHGGITEELLKTFKVYKVDNNLVGGEVQCYTTL
jgi:hypothetical protein